MQGKEKNKRCKKELPKDIMGFCVGLVVGSCVLCSEESAEEKVRGHGCKTKHILISVNKLTLVGWPEASLVGLRIGLLVGSCVI